MWNVPSYFYWTYLVLQIQKIRSTLCYTTTKTGYHFEFILPFHLEKLNVPYLKCLQLKKVIEVFINKHWFNRSLCTVKLSHKKTQDVKLNCIEMEVSVKCYLSSLKINLTP